MTTNTNFRNLTELLDFFKDEETCKAYYEQKRWGGNVACPHCGSLKIYRTNRGYKCGEKLCNKKFSVTVGTIFENTKIGLRTWFAAMYLISTGKKGVSSLQLAEQLGVTQKTAWFVLHRIREMLNDNKGEQLQDVVQIDESYFGGKNKNRHADKKVDGTQGRSTKDKTPVLGAKGLNGKVVLQVVVDTSASTIQPIIEKWVKGGSIMVSDEWRGYNGLDKKYLHVTVNHSGGEYVRGAFHTNGIENFWSTFKRGIIGIYHQVSAKHLQRYCDEFGYRHNERKSTGVEKFDIALTKVSSARITYQTLIGK